MSESGFPIHDRRNRGPMGARNWREATEARIRAKLDEIERDATAAGGKPWHWDHGFGDMCNDRDCPYGMLTQDHEGPGGLVVMHVHGYDVTDGWQGAAHIQRHHPAAALRTVAAVRRILDEILPDIQGMEVQIEGEWGVGPRDSHEGQASELLVGALADMLDVDTS